MTPKPESETDPWTGVRSYHTQGHNFYLCAAVDDARAAEAAQHQQEMSQQAAHIANLEHMVREHGQFGDLFQPGGRFHKDAQLEPGSVAVVAGGKWLVARLVAVEAEWDKQAEQIAMLLTICPNCAGLMAPEPPDSGCSGVYCPECRSNSAELWAERDRLKAALQPFGELAYAYDPPEDDDHEMAWDPSPHWDSCAARAALTPQGQSTDGETR